MISSRAIVRLPANDNPETNSRYTKYCDASSLMVSKMVGSGIMNTLVFRNTYCSESDVATLEVVGTIALIWADPLSALVIIGPHG